MESLGFSDNSSVWSDRSRSRSDPGHRGRHESGVEVPRDQPDEDWSDLGRRLGGTDTRWGMVVFVVLALAAASGLAFWLYQRPGRDAEAARSELQARAESVVGLLPELEALNSQLAYADSTGATTALASLDEAARSLFEISSDVPDDSAELRATAVHAAGSLLDTIGLVDETIAYRQVLMPVLVAPELETDPNLIELDQAVRDFTEWQANLDSARSALRSGVMPDLTSQLDQLSADMPSTMSAYVDALRIDDQRAATSVVSDIAQRLAAIGQDLETSLADTQQMVSEDVVEIRQTLQPLLG